MFRSGSVGCCARGLSAGTLCGVLARRTGSAAAVTAAAARGGGLLLRPLGRPLFAGCRRTLCRCGARCSVLRSGRSGCGLRTKRLLGTCLRPNFGLRFTLRPRGRELGRLDSGRLLRSGFSGCAPLHGCRLLGTNGLLSGNGLFRSRGICLLPGGVSGRFPAFGRTLRRRLGRLGRGCGGIARSRALRLLSGGGFTATAPVAASWSRWRTTLRNSRTGTSRT